MKPESPETSRDGTISPYVQEIEYALILSRMINTVKDDPAEIRATIYEFARAKLKLDTSWAEAGERERLASALETAIHGVEAFSVRQAQTSLPESPAPAARIAHGPSTAEQSSRSLTTVGPVTPAAEDIFTPERGRPYAEVRHVLEVRTSPLGPMLARFFAGMLLFAGLAGLAYYKEKLPVIAEHLHLTAAADTPMIAAVPQAIGPAEVKNVVQQQANAPAFPVPSDYGIYALSSGTLSELNALSERVPDKRIAVSTPITRPSRTTLPDGRGKFIIFRRDLAGNAPDRIEVRVVARVVRASTFDAKGKPSSVAVSDAWNIRNLSYELRVRPIAGNPEMLLVQSENPDFVLPAGRYALVVKEQGYDFVVAGAVTDLSQCLERTDAVNGSFYSECKKP
jgi:hypothetical protein